jgi:hypothetical protein
MDLRCSACKQTKKACPATCPVEPFFREPEDHEDYNGIHDVFTLDYFKNWLKEAADT